MPKCLECGASDFTQFNMLPKVPGFKFGEICVPCENQLLNQGE